MRCTGNLGALSVLWLYREQNCKKGKDLYSMENYYWIIGYSQGEYFIVSGGGIGTIHVKFLHRSCTIEELNQK
uniref:Uncharacterized protein n=1 Tax=Setaria viridis TaxID=4556 RepID=A0A4U6TY28_SETVI|nr:hypothetical protein SEVIR_8G258300v2 [Setaria viridis]